MLLFPKRRRVSAVILVDSVGRVLMQHRDAFAPTAPNKWGLPGGGIKPGESPEDAARRELLEETGLEITNEPRLFCHSRPKDPTLLCRISEWYIYFAATPACQEDIVLGEGQAMLFMSPSQALKQQLSPTAAEILPQFFSSQHYHRMLLYSAWIG